MSVTKVSLGVMRQHCPQLDQDQAVKRAVLQEGVFSLARSIWGSWEKALRGTAGLSAETRTEEPRRHGSPLLTGVSCLPGCPP